MSIKSPDGTKVMIDTVTGRVGERLSVVKEGSTTYVPYSNGTELTWEKTEQGDGKRLKEVRTLTRVKKSQTHFSIEPEDWDRIFGPKKEGTA